MSRTDPQKSDLIQLGNFSIEQPRAIDPARFITKVGRINMRGILGGDIVNIYECHSEKHALFVQAITTSPDVIKYFPKTYGVYDKYIITEWVEGKQLKPKQLAKNKDYVGQLATLYEKLHSTKVPDSAGFDYFEDHIFPRFKRACDALGLPSFFGRIKDDYLSIKQASKDQVISHPDMTPANIIITPQGQIKSIDNELLCSSNMPFFDFFNIIHGFGVSLNKNAALWSDIFAPIKPYLAPEHEDALLSLWLMRISGSYFVSGRLKKILKLAGASHDDLKESLSLWKTIQIISNAK